MNKRQYMAVVRNAAVLLSGILAHRGVLRSDDIEQVLALAMGVAALAWSLHEKRERRP